MKLFFLIYLSLLVPFFLSAADVLPPKGVPSAVVERLNNHLNNLELHELLFNSVLNKGMSVVYRASSGIDGEKSRCRLLYILDAVKQDMLSAKKMLQSMKDEKDSSCELPCPIPAASDSKIAEYVSINLHFESIYNYYMYVLAEIYCGIFPLISLGADRDVIEKKYLELLENQAAHLDSNSSVSKRSRRSVGYVCFERSVCDKKYQEIYTKLENDLTKSMEWMWK